MILEIAQDGFSGALHVILHLLAAVFPAFFFGGCPCCVTELDCDCSDPDVPTKLNISIGTFGCGGCSIEGREPATTEDCETGVVNTPCDSSHGVAYEMQPAVSDDDCGCGVGNLLINLGMCVTCTSPSGTFDCDDVDPICYCACTGLGNARVDGTVDSCDLDPFEVTATFDLSGTAACAACDTIVITWTE